MSKINDGGSAFPQSLMSVAVNPEGMSLRDWFAGQALIGLCQADMTDEQFVVSPDLLARTAYRQADAMLLARSRPEEDNG